MEKFKRKKKFNLINSFFYFIDRVLPIQNKIKLKFYLNLLFVFKRLSYEKSYILLNQKHPSTQNTINNLKKYVKKNHNILDIGSGNGNIAESLSPHVKKIFCIDHNKKAINKAKEQNKRNNIFYICDDIKKIRKYNIKNIDLIVCSHIIEHLEFPFSFLNYIKKFKSKIYIEVPDFEHDNLNQVKKKIKYNLNYSDDDHIYEFDRYTLKKKLTDHKFIILDENYQHGVISLLIK